MDERGVGPETRKDRAGEFGTRTHERCRVKESEGLERGDRIRVDSNDGSDRERASGVCSLPPEPCTVS